MATRISEIVEKQAYDQIAQLNKMLGDALDMFNKTANGAILLNKAISESNSFVQAANNTNSTTKALTELEKIERQIITTQAKLNASQTLQAQILAEEKMRLQELNRETKEFIKSKQVQAGSIEELRMKLRAAQKEYDAMAASERNAGRGTELITHIQKVDKELKSLEANSGRFQRNVGNYASATHSLSQVFREIPAFTYSAQTGILGISNNLPILADNFKKVAAESGGAMNAIKIFGASIFSMGNIFTIALGLFTIFSKQIFDFVGNLTKGKSAVDGFTESQRLLNEAFADTSVKEAIKNVEELGINIKLAKEGFLDKETVVKQYNETIGKTTGLVTSLDEAEQQLTKNGKAYIEMMLYKAAANLALEEAAKKALDAETKRQKDLSAIDASKGKYGGFIADILNLNKEPGVDLEEATRKDVNAAADELKKGGDVYIGIAEEFFRKVANITAKNKFNMPLSGITSTSGTNKANEKSVQSAKKTAEEKLKIEKEYVDDINALDRQVQLMNEKTDAATIARVTKVLEEKKRLNAKYAKEELDLINENLAANAVMWDNADQERLEASIKRLETFQAAAGIIQNALNNIGGIISDRANLKADQAVKEIDRVKEAELAALDKVAMSTQQKEEEKKRIETQAESRRKQIERERITALRKAAQFQKAADIASIISSTAAAIMGFQKNPGGPAGIVLSIAAGVTGGIQLARAAAAPLPQYFKGRKGGKMEFAEVNEKGPELLETKDGKFSIANGGKRGVTLLQEGEKVHTNESFMKMVSNRAHSILSTHPTPNSNSYERAYLQAINEMKDEFTGMKQMLKQKKDGFIIKGNFGHDIYVDSIRM